MNACIRPYSDSCPHRQEGVKVQFSLSTGVFMNTLAEIETAADALPPEQKQELILFLATRIRAMGIKLPPPRQFTPDQVQGWITDDEADMQRFRDEK